MILVVNYAESRLEMKTLKIHFQIIIECDQIQRHIVYDCMYSVLCYSYKMCGALIM